MTKQTNIRRPNAKSIETRQKRRALQSAMSTGLRSSFKPTGDGSSMSEFMSLLEQADRKLSKA